MLSLAAESIAGLLRSREERARDDKKARKNIQRLALLTGLAISFILKADAVQMFISGEPGEVLGWQNVIFYDEQEAIELTSSNYDYFRALTGNNFGPGRVVFTWAQLALGMGISGSALSFGSRLWNSIESTT
jgi:hypothetical protein